MEATVSGLNANNTNGMTLRRGERRVVTAGAIADRRGVLAAPGAIAVEGVGSDGDSFEAGGADGGGGVDVVVGGGSGRRRSAGRLRVVAVGSPAEVDAEISRRGWGADSAAGRFMREERPCAVLIPGLVNAHVHLDLTHIGPVEVPSGAFLDFGRIVMQNRRRDAEGIAESARGGVGLSRAAGVVAVGDIDGTPWGVLRGGAGGVSAGARSPVMEAALAGGLAGVGYVELISYTTQAAADWELRRGVLGDLVSASRGGCGWRVGLSPHATYTVDAAAGAWAGGLGLPLCMHVAESQEEREFVTSQSGPFRAFLDAIGTYSRGFDEDLTRRGEGGRPETPVERGVRLTGANGRTASGRGRVLFAHVNDASEADLELLARHGVAVAYCPFTSDGFRSAEKFGPHKYRRMLELGVPVGLGTDSIINMPKEAADPAAGAFGPLHAARYLRRRDGTDSATLLSMATVHGASGLGFTPSGFEFAPGNELAGLVAVDGRGDGPVERAPMRWVPGRAPWGVGSPLDWVMETRFPPRLLLVGEVFC